MESKNPTISVAVSCYNEEKFIVDTIDAVTTVLKELGVSHEVIAIDDVSKDSSVQKIKDYIAQHPHAPVRLVENKRNRGFANNFVDGAFYAKGTYYRLCCGDNSEPRDVLKKVFEQIGKADVIIPIQDQWKVKGKSFSRKAISRLVTRAANLISGFSIGYYNGMPIILRQLVMRYPPVTYGFGFQIDIVTRLLDEGVTFLQIPDVYSFDLKGKDSVAFSWRNILSVIHTFLEVVFRRLRRTLYRKHIPQSTEIPYR